VLVEKTERLNEKILKFFALLFLILYNHIPHKCTIDIINTTHKKYIRAADMISYNVVHQCNTYCSINNYTTYFLGDKLIWEEIRWSFPSFIIFLFFLLG
jgi:hypothetical protein